MNKLKTYEDIIDKLLDISKKDAYNHLLKTVEWNNVRVRINKRDHQSCTICGSMQGAKREIPFNDEELTKREAELTALAEAEVIRNSEIDSRFNLTSNSKSDYLKILSKYRGMIPAYHNKHVVLDVHHTYYVDGKLPWEYPDESLKTLCRSCHEFQHYLFKTPVYDSPELTIITHYRDDCSKCSGTGYVEEYEHYQNGICFDCGGTGGDWIEGTPPN